MATDSRTAATVNGLFNYDSSDSDDPFKDKHARNARDDNRARSASVDADEDTTKHNILEEVKITKKRKPIAKLDEARLLSAPGIPQIRALARSGRISKKLRLKGKGHEFSDVARLLNYYQLWLDNLYPRAKFADGLQLVEKAGHTKRMQLMRKEWIDEGKPGYRKEVAAKQTDLDRHENDDLYGGEGRVTGDTAQNEPDVEEDSLFIPDSRPRHETALVDDGLPDGDELEALLAEGITNHRVDALTIATPARDADSEGEDDLDALLAEQQHPRRVQPASTAETTSKPRASMFDDDDDDDMDDLDAILAEHEQLSKPKSDISPANISGSTAASKAPRSEDVRYNQSATDEDDDLDAILAEHEASNSRPRPTPENAATVNPQSHEDPKADVNDDDMFSSSPVQNVPETSHAMDVLPPPSSQDGVASRHPERNDRLEDDHGSGHGEQAADVDELEADDMFSSSPVLAD